MRSYAQLIGLLAVLLTEPALASIRRCVVGGGCTARDGEMNMGLCGIEPHCAHNVVSIVSISVEHD